jgi:L,D-transpeptidase catalytic domain
MPWWRVIGLGFVVVVVLAAGSSALLARLGRPYSTSAFLGETPGDATGEDAGQIRRRAARAADLLERNRPRGVYIVVDSYRNRLRLYRNGELLRAAICSTGTGVELRDPRNGRVWIFDTPLGERVVEHKVRNPVWAKPDWAFIEEGELPPTDANERFDSNSLGDYALYIGDGYIIHGTLFQTLLGRRVTHGCVRLGDQDLDFVYHHVPVGSKVFLY